MGVMRKKKKGTKHFSKQFTKGGIEQNYNFLFHFS